MPSVISSVIDLTEQDFVTISDLTGRLFEVGVNRSADSVSTEFSPTDIQSSVMNGKHVWMYAQDAKELSERIRHFHSAYKSNPTNTSGCVCISDSVRIPLALLKGFRLILTVPKGELVRQRNSDKSWSVVRSPERLRVFYLASSVDYLSVEAGSSVLAMLAVSQQKLPQGKYPRMLFSGRAAAAEANILFDSGASVNFVSAKFAKQTGISIRPSAQTIRLANDQVLENLVGEATVYVRLGAFHKPVKCFVMDLLYEVDLILGDEFMTQYDCVLHYARKCIVMQKGKRKITVNSPPLPRTNFVDPDETNASLLSHTQLKRMMRKGASVFLAVLKPLDDDKTSLPADVIASTAVGQSTMPEQQTEPTISPEKRWVSDLLEEFSEVFKDPLPVGLPPERAVGHSIPTEPGHPPPFRPMYRLSPLEYRELERQITEFLKAGILEVSQSPYGAPVLFVPKANGRGLRLCVDYRALNSITVKNRCTLPRIDDLLDAVSGAKYFTSLDLTSGYHQILISEEDRPKTAFRTPFGHFQFKVLIEGLTNAPATFQTVMNSIFAPYIRRFVVVYLDDILIFSRTEAEHQAHVRLVLEALKRERFYVSKVKSSFAQTEIKYLGHIVNALGIRPDPKKVSIVQNWPVPQNVHDVRSFLGLTNYFRKFIDHYSSIAVPLTNLTKKTVGWNWTPRCQEAFEQLKRCLSEAPLLRAPIESKPYEVVVDASDYGLGGVLLQDGHPVAFESRKLIPAEMNYTTTEKEMLAVVHALRVWRCYLEGAEFTVFTDHVSNTFFQTQPCLSRRQARWSEFLQRFGVFKWEYRKGGRNVADVLSRTLVYASCESPTDVDSAKAQPFGAVIAAADVATSSRRMFQIRNESGQTRSASGDQVVLEPTFDLSPSLLKSFIVGSKELCEKTQRDANWADSNQLSTTWEGLVLKENSLIVVPDNDELRRSILAECHDTQYAGHYGKDKTRQAVGRLFWWPSLTKDVAKYVSNCVLCQRNKSRRHKPFGALQPLPVPEKPWHSVTFDFIVKLPETERKNNSICVFVDKLTKMVHFVACREEISGRAFAELYIDQIWRLHGLSKEFITDRDTRFTSAFWQGVTELIGTKHVMSSSFHPQTDGQSERVNQTLETYLRHFVSVKLNDWDTLLSRAEYAHNTAVHSSTGQTPFYLNFGYHPRSPPGEKLEVVHPDSAAFVEKWQSALAFARNCLIAAQQRQKAFADQNRKEKEFSVGDQVLLSTKYLNIKHAETNRKLLPKYVGPFEVVQVVGPVSYKLKMIPGWKIHPVFHVSLLEPYKTDGRVQPSQPPVIVEGALEYEVESILGHRFRGRRHPRAYYLVAWKGYGSEHNLWEPEEHLVNAPEKVAEYWKSRAEQQEGLGASLIAQ